MKAWTILSVILLFFAMVSFFFFEGKKSTVNRKTFMKTAFATEPVTLDPRKNGDIYSSFLQKMIFEGLLRLEKKGAIEWGVAESVDISEDQRTYTFHLRDAVWSDGHPITAYDFEYAWKKVLDPSFGAPSSFLFYPIENAQKAVQGEIPLDQVPIRALDPKTFQVRLAYPTPYFLSLITFCCFFPVPRHLDQAHPEWPHSVATIVSNGPYQLKEWTRASLLTVEKNPLYWDRKEVALDGIEVYIIPDEKTALRMFERGDLDLLGSITTPLSLDDLGRLREEGQLKVEPMGMTCFTTFNLDHPLFSNVHLRNAFSAAIDRQEIVQNVMQMGETAACGFIPPSLGVKEPFTGIKNREIAPAKLLFEKGLIELGTSLEKMEPISLSYLGTEQFRRLALALQQQWKKTLGIEVKLEEVELKTLLQRLEQKKYAMGLYHWAVHYLDPLSILDRFKSPEGKKNFPGFFNAKYAELLDLAQATKDPSLRSQSLKKAEEIMNQEMPLSPLFHYNQGVLQSRRFEPIPLTPLGDPLYKKIRPLQHVL